MVKLIRRIAAGVRDELDRRMHARRRDRAAERLVGIGPGRVIFVCHGNICRSPYAARRMARSGSLDSTSAGFIGPGRTPPSEALNAASARGVDHDNHVSQLLTRESLASADAVFVFDRHNLKRLRQMNEYRAAHTFWLGDFDPMWSGKRAIIDPWGRGQDHFDLTFDRIDRCVDSVLDAVARNS